MIGHFKEFREIPSSSFPSFPNMEQQRRATRKSTQIMTTRKFHNILWSLLSFGETWDKSIVFLYKFSKFTMVSGSV